MTAGVLVVTSNLSSMPEVGGNFAFYCDPHDPRSIARAIRDALNLDREERMRLITEARKWAGTLTWDRMARSLERRVLNLLDGEFRNRERGDLAFEYGASSSSSSSLGEVSIRSYGLSAKSATIDETESASSLFEE